MTLKELIGYAVEASLFVLVLSIGLESRWRDIFHILRRPAKLMRAIIAVNVIVPAVTVALCLILPISPWTRAGLVMMAVSPLAPFAPLKMLQTGAARGAVVGTHAALMLMAIIIIPLTALILRPLAPNGVLVPVSFVAEFVAMTVLAPLSIGVTVHFMWEKFSESAAPLLRKASFAIILPAAFVALVKFASYFPTLWGDGTLVVIVATIATALGAGFALGGPVPSMRRALGEAAATRHPGLAAGIAQLHSDDPRILAAIVLFLFASIILTLAYARMLASWSDRSSQPSRPK